MSSVVGWGVWVSKPNYMVDCESFFKRDGETYEDVVAYAETLEDVFKYYVNITEYLDLEDPYGYHEVPIDRWRKNSWNNS